MDPQTAQPQPSRFSGRKILIGICSLLAIAVLLLIALILVKNSKSNKVSTEVNTGLARDLITIGQSVPVTGVFPNSSDEGHSVEFNYNIFDGLTRFINGKVSPALATSWINPDQTTWRFTLRKGVTFHNGDPFTAADVKFSIDQALNQKNAWPDSSNLSTIKSVEVVDNFTVDIKTNTPDPVLLNRLPYAYIVSEKQYKSKSAAESAVGTGPYKFVSLDDKQAVLEANSSYYLGTPKVKKIVLKFFPGTTTDDQLAQALRKGEIDLVSLNSKTLTQTLKSDFQIKEAPSLIMRALYLDTREKSPFVNKTPNPLANKLVRQAIYKAIDINQVIKEAGIPAEPASQLVPESVFGYNPKITRLNRSVEAAKSLMKQAGLESGFSVTLDAINTPENVAVAGVIAKNLSDINISVKVNKLDPVDQSWVKLTSGDTSAFIMGVSAETLDSGEIFTDGLHTTTATLGASNFFNYSNSEMDKLIEGAASTFEPKTRLPKLEELMTQAMEELPILPLYNQFSYTVIRNNFDWTPRVGMVNYSEITGRGITTK